LGDPKPAEVPAPKLTEKKEITPTAEKTPEPPPQTKPDPIAEKIKKQDDQKPQQAKTEPLPPKKPEKQQPKFDADKIAALLDKREPQRNAITGNELNTAPSFGTALGNASQLSQSEIDALRSRLMGLWSPPVGIKNPEAYVIRVRIQLDKNRSLSAPPTLLSRGQDAIWEAAAASALRAVMRAQPYDMLKIEHYDTWKDIEVTFDPREMFGGG
jgi:colicin import membrane protein